MIRKTLIAAAAVAGMTLGMLAVPASAATTSYLGAPQIGNPDFKQDVSHWVWKCSWKSVKTYYGWKKKKVCHKVFPKHYAY